MGIMTNRSTPLAHRIHRMDCTEEVAVLKRELGPFVDGEEKLAFDILHGKMIVPANTLTACQIQDAVAQIGMRAEPWRNEKTSISDDSFWE